MHRINKHQAISLTYPPTDKLPSCMSMVKQRSERNLQRLSQMTTLSLDLFPRRDVGTTHKPITCVQEPTGSRHEWTGHN